MVRLPIITSDQQLKKNHLIHGTVAYIWYPIYIQLKNLHYFRTSSEGEKFVNQLCFFILITRKSYNLKIKLSVSFLLLCARILVQRIKCIHWNWDQNKVNSVSIWVEPVIINFLSTRAKKTLIKCFLYILYAILNDLCHRK